MKHVLIITGPTCSGKTELAIDLAKKLNTQIISADSRQIYKYLNIGTAKPTPSQLSEVKHYFIDELMPDEEFNADLFSRKANQIIAQILFNCKTPIVVGGSGLYIKALIDGLDVPVDANLELRKSLMEKRELFGNEFIHNELKKVDSISAEKLLPQNYKRVIRALEVFYQTNTPIWSFKSEKKFTNFNFIQYSLLWDRNLLYERINSRVDKMIELGLIYETEMVLKLGYNENLNSLNTVGYKEIIDFLQKKISLEKAIYLIKRNTRRFAKKQITWLNKDKRIIWLNANKYSTSELSEIILKEFYERQN
jgi:tRNA dimethylallyltransferase